MTQIIGAGSMRTVGRRDRFWSTRVMGREPEVHSVAQTWALACSVWRELSWGLPQTGRIIASWKSCAAAIPDATLREDALYALEHKQSYLYGATLFTVLTRRRNRDLLRAVVSYEAIIDYLDQASERHPTAPNGRRLHRALLDAVDLDREPLGDYYANHPWSRDGGYLEMLVQTCRSACARLPSIEAVLPIIVRESRRKVVLGLNHEPDPPVRDAALKAWAIGEFPVGVEDLAWFELTGASSSSLLTLALMAHACEQRLTTRTVESICESYWPWVDLSATLLDSYVDWEADLLGGDHVYLDHYPDAPAAVARVHQSVELASRRVLDAPRGHRHAVIVASMVALCLSAPSTSSPKMRAATRLVEADAGALARQLVPVLRLWRRIYRQDA